jgi:MscS family membrane protein
MVASRINSLAVLACYSRTVTCLLLLCMFGDSAGAAQDLHPLAPPDTSSPRATLKTFLNEMNKVVHAYKAGHRDEAVAYVQRAARCLNLEKQPAALRYMMGFYSTLYLEEILDRIEIPPDDEIPDAKAFRTEKISSWTIPYTEITIALVKDESPVDHFLFSSDTVRNAQQYYFKVKNLPYKPQSGGGAVLDQLRGSGSLILSKTIIEQLPDWTKTEVYGEAVWQWIGLILYFCVAAGMVLFAYKAGSQALGILDKKFNLNLKRTVGGLMLPAALILFSNVGLWFTIYGLRFLNADAYLPVAFVLLFISSGAWLWFIAAGLSRIAAVVIAVGRFEPTGMYAQLIRFGFVIATTIVVAGAAIHFGARLGLPTYSMVTGLGIGGLAVALAGREALSNLIGTVAIILDQPFKMGDFVVLGEGDRGTVSEIGLRSTRIKRLDGILVSIPNANIANMKIINESAPVAKAQISVPVGAAYGSSVNEVEQALLTASHRCEYVVSDPAPSVGLVRFGESGLEFQLLVWIIQPEFRAKATNQINRAICEELEKRRIELPVPHRDIRIRREAQGEREQ